jgi:hypothetical protein
VSGFRAVALSAAAMLMGTACTGCGGDGGTTPSSEDFTKADLKNLVFAPSEAPPDLVYSRKVSGPAMLEKEGRKQFISEIKSRGLVADYGAQFFPKSHHAHLGFAETIALLFKDPTTASDALDFLRQLQLLVFNPATEIEAPALGQESWGVRGKFRGRDLTYIYGWRRGNVVQMMTLSPKAPGAGPQQTLELAKELAAHERK